MPENPINQQQNDSIKLNLTDEPKMQENNKEADLIDQNSKNDQLNDLKTEL